MAGALRLPRALSPRSVRSVPTGARIVAVAVLVLGVVGYAVYGASRRTVTVSVDGATREISTTAATVGAALDEAGVQVSERDLVSPTVGSPLEDGMQVLVRHARPLLLTIDGVPRTVWTTADTVGEALAVVDLRTERASLSVSRSARLGRDGLSVAVALPTPVDGFSSRRVTIPPRTVRRPTAELRRGVTRVVRPGRPGVRLVTHRYQWVDGRVTERTLLRTRLLRPRVDRLLHVGTRVPKPAPRPTQTASATVASSAGGSSAAGSTLNWAALASCESGGNPQAVNPAGPYYGLYQFDLSTWQAVGGTGLPTQASSAEQTRRAQLLYQRAGASPWPVCGSRLYD